MKSNKSKVCIIANNLTKNSYNRSEAFRRAWQFVKFDIVETKVAGVTSGRRQEALEHLTKYDTELISVDLKRETANEYDCNAIAVIIIYLRQFYFLEALVYYFAFVYNVFHKTSSFSFGLFSSKTLYHTFWLMSYFICFLCTFSDLLFYSLL